MAHSKRPAAYSSSGYHHTYDDDRNAKRKKAAAADKPPMPKSAYVVFCNEMRPKVRKEFPGMDFVEITRHVAKLWKAISADERQFYEEVGYRHARALRTHGEQRAGHMTLREQQEWMDLRGGSSQLFGTQSTADAVETGPQDAHENTSTPTDAHPVPSAVVQPETVAEGAAVEAEN